jgi:hypothetical protein
MESYLWAQVGKYVTLGDGDALNSLVKEKEEKGGLLSFLFWSRYIQICFVFCVFFKNSCE